MDDERLDWDEIVRKYPDRWVALVDCDLIGGVTVSSAIVCAVCKDSDRLAEEIKLVNRGVHFIWKRTTELEGAFVFLNERVHV